VLKFLGITPFISHRLYRWLMKGVMEDVGRVFPVEERGDGELFCA